MLQRSIGILSNDEELITLQENILRRRREAHALAVDIWRISRIGTATAGVFNDDLMRKLTGIHLY